ncbi:transmembrane protein C16orf54 homolog [Rhinatrema bivittatum]|uniref:transmembrane protein C16orf54 homolog n=1 Tax=Rhinatrema bivittatum TaxID=194408 RepID=UPI00112AF125|nr:transmembrane protein C16orf54 homolog [Rhinatrema bivittatum]XP_029462803.1 transmembrane protein C16orf54 homolog [Rhinatrema bivittatum]
MAGKGISQLGYHTVLVLLSTVALRPTLSQMGPDEPLNLTSWATRMKKNEQESTTRPLPSTPEHVAPPQLCRHCLIAMVTLAAVAAVFMVSTVVLCSRMLASSRNSPRPSMKARTERRIPTGGLWIEQEGTMKERTESWYKGDTHQEKRQKTKSPRRISNTGMSLWIPPATSIEERSLLWYSSSSSKETRVANGSVAHPAEIQDSNSIQPRITLDQISGFWHGGRDAWETSMNHGGATSFQRCSQSSSRSDLGGESITTEEQGWTRSNVPERQWNSEELDENEESEEEVIPVVQPKVTLQEISEFWNNRAARHTQLGQRDIKNTERKNGNASPGCTLTAPSNRNHPSSEHR